MAVRIAIIRRVPESMVGSVRPVLLKLRSLAMEQPGYFGGETLVNTEDPEEYLVLSSWNSAEDWKSWTKNSQRRELADQLKLMLGTDPTLRIYQHG